LRVVVGEFSVLRLLPSELAFGLATVGVVASSFVALCERKLNVSLVSSLEQRCGVSLTSGTYFFDVQGLMLGSLYIRSTFSSERFEDS
jgi:hypothetical protein